MTCHSQFELWLWIRYRERLYRCSKLCGLCDKEFSNSQLLDDHLSECEIFVCSNSGCNKLFETLTSLKEHIKEEHQKGSPAHYQFSYWIYSAKDKSEKEIYKKYHTIYPKDWWNTELIWRSLGKTDCQVYQVILVTVV